MRKFLKSAQGPAAPRHTAKELTCSSGGALDSGPVVREFLKAHKARPRPAIQQRNSPVLRAGRLILGLLCANSSRGAREYSNIAKVAVVFRIVETVPDHKFIGNLKTCVFHMHRFNTPVGFVKQRDDLERLRMTLRQ